MMKAYEANVKVPKQTRLRMTSYDLVRTTIVAQTPYPAQKGLEGMYGQGCLIGLPKEVR